MNTTTLPLESTVTLLNCVYPDGTPVLGTWTVIGRRGSSFFIERDGTRLLVPTASLALA